MRPIVHEAASVRGWKGSVFAVSVGAAATSSLRGSGARIGAGSRRILRMLCTRQDGNGLQ